MKINRPIIFFDGVCNLCNAWVDFVMQHKKPGAQFFIASLQGSTAKTSLPEHFQKDLSSVVLLSIQNKTLVKSQAIFAIAQLLHKPWCYLAVFRFLPLSLCDVIYDWIAAKRYQWWGKKDLCRLPTEAERTYFLP